MRAPPSARWRAHDAQVNIACPHRSGTRGYLTLAVAAVGMFVVLGPKIDTVTPTLPSATSYESLIFDAFDADKLNDLLTTGAPQQ